MKKYLLVFALIVLYSSCKKDKEVTINYDINIFQFNGSFQDWDNLEGYFEDNNCFTGTWTVTEHSVEAADLRINYIMTQEKRKIDRTELKGLLGKGCSFIYAAARHEDITDSLSPVVFVGKFMFPQ